jgi:hypothetical protein
MTNMHAIVPQVMTRFKAYRRLLHTGLNPRAVEQYNGVWTFVLRTRAEPVGRTQGLKECVSDFSRVPAPSHVTISIKLYST